MVEKVEMVVVVDLVLLEQEEEVMKVATVVEQEGLLVEPAREVKQTQDQNHVTKVDQEKDQKSVVDHVKEATDTKKEQKKELKDTTTVVVDQVVDVVMVEVMVVLVLSQSFILFSTPNIIKLMCSRELTEHFGTRETIQQLNLK